MLFRRDNVAIIRKLKYFRMLTAVAPCSSPMSNASHVRLILFAFVVMMMVDIDYFGDIKPGDLLSNVTFTLFLTRAFFCSRNKKV